MERRRIKSLLVIAGPVERIEKGDLDTHEVVVK